MTTLFAQLTDDDTDDEHRRDLVMFLKEFCTFSQTLQPPGRESFFKVAPFENLSTIYLYKTQVLKQRQNYVTQLIYV